MRQILASFSAALLAVVATPAAAQEVSYSPADLSGYMTTASANTTIAQMQATDAAIQSHLPVFLTDVTLAQTAAVSISAGPRQITVATNCIVGDRLVMSPSDAAPPPPGYMLGDIRCTATGTAVATLYAPLLAIGAGYSITARVTAFR